MLNGYMAVESEETARSLLAVFLAKNGDGSYVYEGDEVRAFLPLVFLTLVKAVGWNDSPPSVQQALAMFAEDIDFRGGDAAAFTEALERHYGAHPPNEHLVRAFRRFLEEQVRESAPDGTSAFVKFLGEELVVAEQGPPPPNSVPSGPLAAFQLKANDKKDLSS
jgi:hypothetical protein